MQKDWSGLRSLLVTFFPMFIATLSLVTSIYNGYLNSRFLDIIQHNVARVEQMRTCRDVIEAFYLVKLQIGAAGETGARSSGPEPAATADAAQERALKASLARFAALGTYLANLQDDEARWRYTELTQQLAKIAADARKEPLAATHQAIEQAEGRFVGMNDDCVRAARRGRL